MSRITLAQLTPWITEAALNAPRELPQHLADRLQVSRRCARRHLDRLVQSQWLQRDGIGRKAVYRPGALRLVVRRYELEGLQEDLPWMQDFAPCFELRPNVARIVQHIFTELLNNAIDHSGGTRVTVSLRQTPTQVQLLVSDDGRGLFDAVAAGFGIQDPTLAMLELAKGKLTSQPERHSGRGLFFSARLADVFDLHANAHAFQRRGWQPDQWWPLPRSACQTGTSVYAAVCVDSTRSLDTTLQTHSLDGAGYRFERTVVPLRLMTRPNAGLEARAQARRVAERLTQFRRIELDFDGIGDVGHGFTDELFRVFGARHPELELVPVNMAPRVAAMVGSVREELAA